MGAERVQVTSRPGFKALPAGFLPHHINRPSFGSNWRDLGNNFEAEMSRMGLQFHSKPIPHKLSFSKPEPPLPKMIRKVPREILETESSSCKVEESTESQSFLLSKHIFLKSWLFHLGDDLQLYQTCSPNLK